MIAIAFAKLMTPFFGAASCSHGFFFLPNWWEYLPTQPSLPNCEISFNAISDIWLVGLAVLDMLLRIAGFVAVVSIMVAGLQSVFSGGNPEKAASSRRRIYNSLYGLAVALIATALVTFIGKQLAK